MKTVILEEAGKLAFADTAEPAGPGAGEALVRIQKVGICGTDITAYRGRFPFITFPRILGHELGVLVEAVGEGVTSLKEGDRCAVEPYLYCEGCPACRRGRTNCCESLRVFGVHCDGGMRDRVILPVRNLHRSNNLSFDELALVETMGIGKHAVSRAQLEEDKTVAILGLGPIGLTVAQFAVLAGARVVALDVSGRRIEMCRKLYGVETLELDIERSLPEQWAEKMGPLPGTVFDATGNAASMTAAFTLPMNSGKLVFVGLIDGDLTFSDPEFHRRELSVLATRNSVAEDFREIIAHMEAGVIDVAPWITHRTEAMQLPEIFDAWISPDSTILKGVVEF